MATFTKSDGAVKKSIYHSDLVNLTASAPATVIFGQPRASRYPNKPPVVAVTVVGDPTTYTMEIEHAGIQQVLASIPPNAAVQVKATGERQGAVLQVLGYSAAPPPQAAAPAQQSFAPPAGPPPAAAPPPNTQPAYVPPREQPPMTRAYFHAFQAAHEVATKVLHDCGDAFARITPGERLEFTRQIATTFYIDQQHNPDRPLRAVKNGNGNGSEE
jgi:hypothetical protein